MKKRRSATNIERFKFNDRTFREFKWALTPPCTNDHNKLVRIARKRKSFINFNRKTEGIIYAPFLFKSQGCIKTLASHKIVNESDVIFSLERGGSLLADHIVDIRMQESLKKMIHFSIPKPKSESRKDHISNMFQDIEAYIEDRGTTKKRITVAITETAISGAAGATLLSRLGEFARRFPKIQFNVIFEQQTIHAKFPDRYRGVMDGIPRCKPSDMKARHVSAKNICVVTGYTLDILGEDTKFQIERLSKRPIYIMSEDFTCGCKITPKAGQCTRDVLRDLMTGKYNDRIRYFCNMQGANNFKGR